MIALLIMERPSLAFAEKSIHLPDSGHFGRAVSRRIDLYDRPGIDGNVIRTLEKDEVLPITKSAVSNDTSSQNPVWYELNEEGFAHSGSIQPVETLLNDLYRNIPPSGILAEVSVPFTDAYWNIDATDKPAYRLYYATTHWILSTSKDKIGNDWYEVLEDFYRESYFVKASDLRVIPLEEITTLSPGIPAQEKRIEVRLADQLVVAYEGDQQVQLFRCSAGITKNYVSLTPTGDFTTDYKRPSRHMIDGNDHHMNTFNLPGIPWISYIDQNGVSFHGTYWHNNFGEPMSHGCINLSPLAAKWIYRWTLPSVPYAEQRGYKFGGGTPVRIF